MSQNKILKEIAVKLGGNVGKNDNDTNELLQIISDNVSNGSNAGSGNVDLSDYYTKEEVDDKMANAGSGGSGNSANSYQHTLTFTSSDPYVYNSNSVVDVGASFNIINDRSSALSFIEGTYDIIALLPNAIHHDHSSDVMYGYYECPENVFITGVVRYKIDNTDTVYGVPGTLFIPKGSYTHPMSSISDDELDNPQGTFYISYQTHMGHHITVRTGNGFAAASYEVRDEITTKDEFNNNYYTSDETIKIEPKTSMPYNGLFAHHITATLSDDSNDPDNPIENKIQFIAYANSAVPFTSLETVMRHVMPYSFDDEMLINIYRGCIPVCTIVDNNHVPAILDYYYDQMINECSITYNYNNEFIKHVYDLNFNSVTLNQDKVAKVG